VIAACPGYPRRRALETIGADAMFVAPTCAFSDAYSAHASTYVYRFDHTPATVRATGLSAVHGSEIVHILAYLRFAPWATAAPPGRVADARGRAPDAADLVGVRRRGGRCVAVVQRLAVLRNRATDNTHHSVS
jgi:hypothetical protein